MEHAEILMKPAILIGLVALGVCGLGGQPSIQPEKPPTLPAGAIRQLGEVRFPNVGHVLGVDFSPDGKVVAAGSWDDTVRLWDVATGKELRQLSGHKGYVKGVIFSQGGKVLLSYGADKTIRVWDCDNWKALHVLQCRAPVGSVAVAPDGRLVTAQAGQHR